MISVSIKKSDLYIRFEVFNLDGKESQKWWTIETRWKESLELFGLFYQHGIKENTLDKTLDMHREYRDQELKEQVEWPSGHQET